MSGRDIIKQITYSYRSSLRTSHSCVFNGTAAFDNYFPSCFGIVGLCHKLDSGYGTYAGQSLTSETQSSDSIKITFRCYFAGGMAHESKLCFISRNAAPIVCDTYIAFAAIPDFYSNGRCCCINGIFQQLFDY